MRSDKSTLWTSGTSRLRSGPVPSSQGKQDPGSEGRSSSGWYICGSRSRYGSVSKGLVAVFEPCRPCKSNSVDSGVFESMA